jgi:hypothetical protein
VLVLLFGSSASGKTTLMHDVLPLVDRIDAHDFDELEPPPGADTAWRHGANGAWIDKALALQRDGIDLLLCGQTPIGEVLAAPNADQIEAISACLVDCDDETRAARLGHRGESWFERTAGPLIDSFTWPEWLQLHLNWADWLRRHAEDPTWMPHVIRIAETEATMEWGRWSSWRAGDARWRFDVIDTSSLSRDNAARALAQWVEAERDRLRAGLHPLAAGVWGG